MNPSEFEEREYEQPLYRQLERNDPRYWSPGQVLEAYLGFDRGLFLTAGYLWNVHGHKTPLPGMIPYHEYWPLLPHFSTHRTRLPDFQLNCFLQTKRCYVGQRLPKRLSALGNKRPFYSFGIDASQHDVLSAAAHKLSGRALFAYAAPVFATSQRLFFLQQIGQIVENSTFPDVKDLDGHVTWYYTDAGATGVGNPEVERIEGAGLNERVNLLLTTNRFREKISGPTEQLTFLSNAIRTAVIEGSEAFASARRAYLVSDWSEIGEFADVNELNAACRAFLEVDAFARRFNLTWLVIGESNA